MKIFLTRLKRNLPVLFRAVFVLLCSPCISQNTEQTFFFAKKLFASSDYEVAVTAYQRALFFDRGVYRAEAYHHLGNCFYELREYEKASHCYDLAFFSEKNDSVKTELVFKKTSSLLLSKKFNDGIAELLSINDDSPRYIRKKRNFYLGIAYFGLNETDISEKHFLSCIDSSDSSSRENLKKQFLRVKKINKRHPKIARILSTILPGAGQFYSGDVKNGLNSLLINAAFIGLGVVVAKNYTPFDAVLAVFPWFQRYYTGGIKKSEIIAIQKINEKRNAVYQNIMDIIASAKN